MARRARRQWAVLETSFGSDGLARQSVLDLGLECPYLYYRARPDSRGDRSALPLLEGYLLVRFRQSEDLVPARSAKGVRSVLGIARDHEVEYLLGLVREDGYVHLPSEDPPAFEFAESVRALAGAFVDQTGEYRGDDPRKSRNGIVVFTLMRREVAASISKYDLAKTRSRVLA